MGLRYFRELVYSGMSRQDIWGAAYNGDVQFVDGDFGSLSNGSDGWAPKKAVTTITLAVANIQNRDGTIYVRPRGTAAGAQTYYADNITIPLTRAGLKIIGAGSNESSPYYGVDVKPSTVTAAVVTIKAPRVTLEGIRWAGTGQTVAYPIISAVDDTSTKICSGLTIRKCRFGNAKGPIATGPAILLNSSWYNTIEDCFFDSNVAAITALTTSGGETIGPFIQRCTFNGPPSVRDCDVYIAGGAASWGLKIDSCLFNDGLPALSAGTVKRFVDIIATITGSFTNNYLACTAAAATGLAGASGSQAIIPATVFMAHNWYDATAAGKGMLDRI